MSHNIYDAPKAPVGMAAGVPLAYTFTPLQLKVLKLYREFHGKPLHSVSLLKRSWRRLVFMLLYFGAGAIFIWNYNPPEMFWSFLGLATTVFLYEINISRVFRKLWPMLDAIIDWDKVDAILGKAPDEPQYPRSAN